MFNILKKSKVGKIVGGMLLVLFLFSIIQPIAVLAQTPTLPADSNNATVVDQVLDKSFEVAKSGALGGFAASVARIAGIGSGASSSCSLASWDTANCLSSILSYISTAITGWLVALAGFLFDGAAYLALDGTTYNSPAIKAAWVVLRDVTNVIFIFLILYVGIQTILGISTGNTRKTLVRIIIVALLINFSLVITGVIIDASNVVALSFYDAFPNTSCLTGSPLTDSRSLSCPFAQAAGLSEFMGQDLYQEWSANTSGGSFLGAAVAGTASIFFLRMIINIIAAFVLFAAAVLFTLRIGMLIFLMILAPLAAAAWALPNTEKYFQKWFGLLLNHSFFAPLFLLLYYVAARLYTSPLYTEGFEGIKGFGGVLIPLILKFAITAIFLVAAIITAKSLGAKGASYVSGLGRKSTAMGLANTYGRFGNSIARSKRMADLQAKSPILGRIASAPFQSMANQKFLKEKGFAARVEDNAKMHQKTYEQLGRPFEGEDPAIAKARQAQYFESTKEGTLGIRGRGAQTFINKTQKELGKETKRIKENEAVLKAEKDELDTLEKSHKEAEAEVIQLEARRAALMDSGNASSSDLAIFELTVSNAKKEQHRIGEGVARKKSQIARLEKDLARETERDKKVDELSTKVEEGGSGGGEKKEEGGGGEEKKTT